MRFMLILLHYCTAAIRLQSIKMNSKFENDRNYTYRLGWLTTHRCSGSHILKEETRKKSY